MREWLNKPYPLIENPRSKLLLVLGFSVFTYLFLLLYQPYGAAGIDGKERYLAGFGLSVLTALAFNYFVLPRIFRRWFRPDRWRIKNEILFVSWSFVLIALINYGYNATAGRDIAPQFSLLQFLGITLSVGVFPLLGLVFIIELRLNRRNQTAARALVQSREKQPPTGPARKRITLVADTQKSGKLELNADDFLFATADSNYTSVFYWQNGAVERQLLRLTLKNLEQQLADFDNLIRCHRSYLVNKSKIRNISGNARSLNLELEHYDEPIPVSRSFPKEKLL